MNSPPQLDYQRPPKPPAGGSPDDALPPVEAPSMTFVTQLFLIPLLIVSIIVVLLVGVRWIVSSGSNPESYIKDLQRSGKGSWQSAAALADMLRDPRNEQLKRNSVLAKQLSEILEAQLATGETDEYDIKLRIFLCRALGEFYTPDGLPVLIEAATTERQPQEVIVRRNAIEAIAVLADNTDPTRLLQEPGLMPALRKAAREQSGGGQDEAVRGDLRARAAFTLGVLGGEKALDVLETMLPDGYPIARYNAATGLARNGDVRGERVLLEMLDPEDKNVIRFENPEKPTDIAWKRALVMINAMEAVERLAEKKPDADLSRLQAAVAHLLDAQLDPLIANRVRTQAKELQFRLEK